MLSKENRGFGLIEALVAIAILAIVALGLSSFITGSGKLALRVEKLSGCANVSQSIVDKIASYGVRDNLHSGFVVDGASATRYPTSGFPNASQFPNWFSLPVVATGDNPVLHNSQFIMGSVGVLQQYVNGNSAFCSDPKGVVLAAGHPLLPASTNLISPVYYLSITPFDRETNQPLGCGSGPFSAVPLGRVVQTNPALDGYNVRSSAVHGPQVAYKARVLVEHQLENGTPSSCSSENTFQHQRDPGNTSDVPRWGALPEYLGSGGPTPVIVNSGAGIFTTCAEDAGYNDVRVTLSFPNLEPGSVLLCRAREETALAIAAQGSWTACDQVRFPSQTGTTSSAWNSGSNQMVITFMGLRPDHKSVLEFKPVDTGGNDKSEAGALLLGSLTIIVDQSGPTLGPVSESTSPRLIGPAGSALEGFMALQAPFNGGAVTDWGRNRFQCVAKAVEFSSSLNSTATNFPENFEGCLCEADSFGEEDCLTCRFTTPPLFHGEHVARITPRDSCRRGTGSTYDWVILTSFNVFNPGPQIVEDGAITQYEIKIPSPNSNLNWWVAACDCTVSSAVIRTPEYSCRSTQPEIGYSCEGGTFEYRIGDPCGRISSVQSLDYQVRGDTGEQCFPVPLCTNPGECCEGQDLSLCSRRGFCVGGASAATGAGSAVGLVLEGSGDDREPTVPMNPTPNCAARRVTAGCPAFAAHNPRTTCTVSGTNRWWDSLRACTVLGIQDATTERCQTANAPPSCYQVVSCPVGQYATYDACFGTLQPDAVNTAYCRQDGASQCWYRVDCPGGQFSNPIACDNACAPACTGPVSNCYTCPAPSCPAGEYPGPTCPAICTAGCEAGTGTCLKCRNPCSGMSCTPATCPAPSSCGTDVNGCPVCLTGSSSNPCPAPLRGNCNNCQGTCTPVPQPTRMCYRCDGCQAPLMSSCNSGNCTGTCSSAPGGCFQCEPASASSCPTGSPFYTDQQVCLNAGWIECSQYPTAVPIPGCFRGRCGTRPFVPCPPNTNCFSMSNWVSCGEAGQSSCEGSQSSQDWCTYAEETDTCCSCTCYHYM